MNFNKVFFTALSSLIVGLGILLNSPSDEYSFKKKTKSLSITPLLASDTPLLNVQFTDLTLSSGLFFTHQQGDQTLTGINESLGSGACVLDYDNDGWQDLFLVNGSGQSRFYGKRHWWQQQNSHQLFKNTGQHHFINTTKGSGLNLPSWGMGCVATDFNNDGYTDLLITTLGTNLLFKNNANGTFSEIKSPAFNAHSTWSTSACAADFDNDGLTDLYVANYIDFDKTKLNYEGQSEFSSNQSELFNPTLFDPVSNRLYKNKGDFSFVDITESSGLSNFSDRSLAVRCVDINNDHLADIIVANAKGDGSNRLYINQGQLKFADLSEQYKFQNNTGSRSIALGDIDNNGVEELFLMTGIQQNNRLYQQRLSSKDKTIYTDIARTWGLTDNISNFQSNWGGGLHDFNQDGYLDFFVTNGFVTPDIDTPRVAKAQPNQLWLNTDRQFQALKTLIPSLSNAIPESSRSSVFADFDNDGDMDIYISNNNNLGQLLINHSPSNAHWLGLQLTDDQHHNSLVGTQVSITYNSGTQNRTISAGDSFLSDSEDRLLFGLGTHNKIKQLTITWPDGNTHHFDDISIDQYVKIDRLNGISPYKSPPIRQQKKLPLPSADVDRSLLFLSLLTELKGIESALPYLLTAIESPDTSIRKLALEKLTKMPPPRNFSLLLNSINDPDNKLAAFAVDKLCAFEEESTIRWLVNALADKRDIIRESVAHCFARLYREEEAMIYRKYLALPALIGLLTDKNSQVQIAAIRALAEAENFRAVTPLISLLNTNMPSVKLEAARALGLIREKVATPHLLLSLQQPDEVADVFAQSLIALRRLGDEHFSTTIEHFFQGIAPFNKVSIQARVDTLLYLKHHAADSIAIKPQTLEKNISLLINQPIADELIIKLIPLLTSLNTHQLEQLHALRKSINPEIRLKSYMTLLTHHPENRLNTLQHLTQETSSSLVNQLLAELATTSFTIPAIKLLPFLEQTSTAKAAIQLLANINTPTAAQILSTALATSPYEALILTSLQHNSFAQQDTATAYLLSTEMMTRQAAYQLYLHKFPSNKLLPKMPTLFMTALTQENEQIRNIALHALSQRKELWAVKKLQHVIVDTTEQQTLRLALIKHYKHPFQKNWLILLRIAKNHKDPIRFPVIKLLSQFNDPSVIHFFQALVNDVNTPEEIKIFALNTLSTSSPEWTLDALTKPSRNY